MASEDLDDQDPIKNLLNRHRKVRGERDVNALYDIYAPGASFVGSGDQETWSMKELSSGFSSPTYLGATEARGLSISHLTPGFVHFIEFLTHEKYGPMRGSGVAAMEKGKWKILHYVLSFSIPSSLAETNQFRELLASH